MGFSGFSKEDFETFFIDSLDERMEVIKERIQPKFKEIGAAVGDDLSQAIGEEMHVHIAKHARRSVNPPKDTWMAFCHNKRGYKKHPHFQVGLFDDHVFLWLAYIYELPNKEEIAKTFLEDKDAIVGNVPEDFVISLDHMKKEAESLATIDLGQALVRFRDVKKGEFLIGRHIDASDPLLQDGEQFIELIKTTFKTLVPLYKMSIR